MNANKTSVDSAAGGEEKAGHVIYEYSLWSKRITATIDEVIETYQTLADSFRKMRDGWAIFQPVGAGGRDVHVTLITEDEEVAKAFGFEKHVWTDDEEDVLQILHWNDAKGEGKRNRCPRS
jgi:hypothetical protein